MGRVLGLDYGSKRIGAAVSDSTRWIASPLEVYVRKSSEQDARHYQALVKENEIDQIVIGLPLHNSGHESESSRLARQWGLQLSQQLNVPIAFYDERFSTRDADLAMQEAGLKRSKRANKIDMLAAQVMLQNYLDDGSPAQPKTPLGLED